ncbi:hypothetical protein JOQ06_013388 [Pogonophryne albipinna]|uniref:Secreted protein n=1 Tax=Pogonophryne albipinna TaxID=1090488 RepID=A0AAD6BHK1_9TELE|nr:hypothetical protein JOQ06_013388 [Pogonophryne albipinna]
MVFAALVLPLVPVFAAAASLSRSHSSCCLKGSSGLVVLNHHDPGVIQTRTCCSETGSGRVNSPRDTTDRRYHNNTDKGGSGGHKLEPPAAVASHADTSVASLQVLSRPPSFVLHIIARRVA